MDKWSSRDEELVIAEQLLGKCFDGFAGLDVIVRVLGNRLTQHGHPDLVEDYMSDGAVENNTDSPFST